MSSEAREEVIESVRNALELDLPDADLADLLQVAADSVRAQGDFDLPRWCQPTLPRLPVRLDDFAPEWPTLPKRRMARRS
jgi:hypothetical protein